MPTQTKGAPGRPKAQTKVEPVKKTTAFKRKVVEQQYAEYEMMRPSGVVFMLPQKGVTIYDEEKNTIREIRYCPNEPSVYVDNQSDKALKQSVIFREGRLFVRRDQPNLKEFMQMHPQNQANGGKLFKVVDKKKEATDVLEREFVLNDAVSMVREKNINELLPVAIYYGININKPVNEIRYNLLTTAKKNPTEFIDAFDNPKVKMRSMMQQASDYQMIAVKDDGVYWFDSNGLIVSVPVGQDAMDVLVRFCMTEKGASVADTVMEKLEKLG